MRGAVKGRPMLIHRSSRLCLNPHAGRPITVMALKSEAIMEIPIGTQRTERPMEEVIFGVLSRR